MKKKVLLTVLSIVIVFIVLSSSTYAIFFRKNKLANGEKYTTGTLDIVINNEDEGLGNSITLSNAFPMSNTEGMSTTPYRFRIINRGNLDYSFDLVLTKSGTINGNYVKVKVEENEIVTLSSNTVTIATGLTLVAGQSKIIEVRIWLDENTPNSEIGNTLSASLSTTGVGQVYLNASEYIMSLSQGSSYIQGEGNGVYAINAYNDNGTTKYHDYRYVGEEVDNYVKFNNDLYRIIGVFDEKSHGKEGKWLIKLISANELISASWGDYNTSPDYTTYSAYTNDWTGSITGVPTNANILLNYYYYNRTDMSSTYKKCSDWTYTSDADLSKSKNCTNLRGYGIQSDNLRNYIEDGVTWYLKGPDDREYNKMQFYECERSDNTAVANCYAGGTSENGYYDTKVTDTNEITEKIGLMYASDYLYASGYVASDDTTALATKNYYY